MLADAHRKQRLSAHIVELVMRRLHEKGLSAASVSRDIVGHDGLIRDLKNGNVPTADRLEALFERLDLEFYVGEPRSTDPTSFPSTLAALDYQEVRAFQTRVSEAGNVGLKLDGTKTSAIVLLQPDLSKALADELTHRAMQIEEKG